jgi:lipopolysaccharide/colanic/teichoic acid biosynthesis glycosyltransferase
MPSYHKSNVRKGAERLRPERPSAPRPGAPNASDTRWAVAPAAPDVERLVELAREPEILHPPAPAPAPEHHRAELARRVVNVVLAAVALVALAPLMTLIALAVRLTSRGPIIYIQERVGLDRRRRAGGAVATTVGPLAPYADVPAPSPSAERRGEDVGGQPYQMYKFRTMRVDAEADGRPVWAAREDPRVTRVGRVLRRTRLDELPQLVNVLRGEMNLVGPRPERPAIAARLRREIDGYALRYRVRPGITGWAQVNHPYDATLDDVRAKVRYDLEYLERLGQRGVTGVTEDLRILARTLPVMLGRRHGW